MGVARLLWRGILRSNRLRPAQRAAWRKSGAGHWHSSARARLRLERGGLLAGAREARPFWPTPEVSPQTSTSVVARSDAPVQADLV